MRSSVRVFGALAQVCAIVATLSLVIYIFPGVVGTFSPCPIPDSPDVCNTYASANLLLLAIFAVQLGVLIGLVAAWVLWLRRAAAIPVIVSAGVFVFLTWPLLWLALPPGLDQSWQLALILWALPPALIAPPILEWVPWKPSISIYI